MDLKLIRNLLRLMERAEVTELEIDDEKEGLRVHLRRGQEQPGTPPVVMMGGPAPAYAPAPAAATAAPAPGDAAAAPARDPNVHEIQSPMVGTFYRSPSPDADPFVQVGQRVDEETTVCIIEAMKVMNEIKAEMRGEVVEVLVENGEPVEYGQPILLVKRG